MRRIIFYLVLSSIMSCNATGKKSELDGKEELSKDLKEISGIVADGDELWAITDKPKAAFYRLDLKGKIKQLITVKNIEATDVEAVAKDAGFIYIGDVGDNDGNREERQIIKVAKTAITQDDKPEVSGEVITFRFGDEKMVDKKKKNNYDCEALFSLGDSIYLFTKRREDMQTELFSLPKTPGNYTARSIGVYNSKGLITDAAINKSNNEVGLIGYTKGHKFPFILLFSGFQGNNFFKGKMERIELADKGWDWQLESFSYNTDDRVYFACEGTKQVKATLYDIKREKLEKLNKNK